LTLSESTLILPNSIELLYFDRMLKIEINALWAGNDEPHVNLNCT
jgi:hypothetical protein